MNDMFFETLSGMGQKLDFESTWNFGGVLGTMLWATLPGRRTETIDAVYARLGKPLPIAEAIAKQSFAHNSRSFLEIFCNRRIDHRFYHDQLTFQNPEQLADIQAADRPVVAVTAHLGSWELLVGLFNFFFPQRGAQVVVRKQRNPALDTMIHRLRSRPGVDIVPHRNATRKVLKNLSRKGVTAFLVDHNCSRDEAVFLPFLGKTAAVNLGPALLALRSEALVWPVFLLRRGKGRYEFVSHKPLDTKTLKGDRRTQVENIARFYTQAVAERVRSDPEQWFWMHRRWKTQPEKR